MLSEPPKPPERLNKIAQDVWNSITRDKPGNWFDNGNLPLLEDYCNAIVECWRLDEEVELMRSEPPEGYRPDEIITLAGRLERSRDMIVKRKLSLAVKLKLSQSSIVRRDNATELQKQDGSQKLYLYQPK